MIYKLCNPSQTARCLVCGCALEAQASGPFQAPVEPAKLVAIDVVLVCSDRNFTNSPTSYNRQQQPYLVIEVVGRTTGGSVPFAAQFIFTRPTHLVRSIIPLDWSLVPGGRSDTDSNSRQLISNIQQLQIFCCNADL